MSTTSDDKQTNLKLCLLLKTQPNKLFYNRYIALHTIKSILGCQAHYFIFDCW